MRSDYCEVMKLSQQYRYAVVTGASRGLGRVFSEMLLDEGVEVWGTARSVDSIFKHERMHPCALDLSEPSSIAAFLEKIITECPQADLLINNAGYGVFSRFEQFPVGDITRQLDVLLTGPIRLCRAFYPMMQKRGSGAIVNVSSLAAQFPLPLMPLYNTSKAGLSSFTRTLEMQSAGTGVRVIDFQPGDYRTAFNDATLHDSEHFDERTARVWAMLEEHLKTAPTPARAAKDMKRALVRGKSGLVKSGSFFQARFAPCAARLASWGLLKSIIKAYYRA